MIIPDVKIPNTTPTRPQYEPHPWIKLERGTGNRLKDPPDLLDPTKDTKLTQL